MGKERVLCVLKLETREWKKYRSGQEFLEQHPSISKSRYSGAKFYQTTCDGLFFSLVSQMDFVNENIDEIIETGKLSKKLPKEKSPYSSPLYIYSVDDDSWRFYKNAGAAQKALGSPTAPTIVRFADLGEFYYDKLRILWWTGQETIQVADTIAAPEGVFPKPNNKEEEMALRERLGMFPYGKFTQYYDDGVLNRPKWNEFMAYVDKLAEEEKSTDGRGLYGLSRRQRVAGYWMDSNECAGVWISMQDASEYCGVHNMAAIVSGKAKGAIFKNLTFRKLDKDEPDPVVTKPYLKEEDEELEYQEALQLIEDYDE